MPEKTEKKAQDSQNGNLEQPKLDHALLLNEIERGLNERALLAKECSCDNPKCSEEYNLRKQTDDQLRKDLDALKQQVLTEKTSKKPANMAPKLAQLLFRFLMKLAWDNQGEGASEDGVELKEDNWAFDMPDWTSEIMDWLSDMMDNL